MQKKRGGIRINVVMSMTLFEEICDYKELNDTLEGVNVKLVLSRYPILMWKDQHRGSILLYGHVHNSVEEYYFKKCIREMNNEKFFDRRKGIEVLRAYNTGCKDDKKLDFLNGGAVCICLKDGDRTY